MAVSRDLTNSIHVDKSDDSRSYSVFYQSECDKGLCYFLIPLIGVAIEISSTVIISWDGRITPHCSATVLPGIVSLFGSSNKFVTARLVVAKAFQSLKKKLFVKMIECMLEIDLDLWSIMMLTTVKVIKKNHCMNRIAIVIEIKLNMVVVKYIGNLEHQLGNVECRKSDVIKLQNTN